MRKSLLALALVACAGVASAQVPMTGAGKGATAASGGACSPGAHATTFLARGSFDATHIAAYCTLINGLDTDSLWAKFDVLVILGTQNSTVAALNLVSTSFSATPNGSPAFVADRGYTGVDASATVYIDTGFAPNIGGAIFVQDSAEISIWSQTNVTSGASGGACMGLTSGAGYAARIFPLYNDGNTYMDINEANNSFSVANANSTGFYLANRSGTSAAQFYKNASSIGSITTTSSTFPATDFAVLGTVDVGGPTHSFGCGNQIAMYSIGGSLSSTDVTNLYNRLRTFGTALGWP